MDVRAGGSKMKKLILLLIMLMAFNAYAGDYYVCPATESGEYQGDDSNDGTSGNPVATVSRALAVSGANDTVYFCSQGEWTGGTILTAEAGVKYIGDTYGTGTRAKFTSTSGSNMVALETSNITFQGFELDMSDRETHGITIGYFAGADISNVIVDHCIVHNNDGVTSDGNGGPWLYSIIVSAANTHTTSNITITNNTVYDTWHAGIDLYPKWGEYNNIVDTVLVRNNTVYNTGYDTTGGGMGVGVSLINNVKEATIEFNHIYSGNYGVWMRNSSQWNSPDNVLSGPTTAVIRYNIIHNNSVGAISAQKMDNEYSNPFSADIYGNVTYNNGSTWSGDYCAELLFGTDWYGGATFNIYNNTLMKNTTTCSDNHGILVGQWASSHVNNPTINFNNNIVQSYNNYAVYDRYGQITNHSNNLVYRSSAETDAHVVSGATTYDRDGTASDLTNWEATAQKTDPAFSGGTLPTGFSGTYGSNMVPNTDYFQLTVDSPAKDTGATLEGYTGSINGAGLTTPIVRPIGSAFDIGAYEYGTVAQSGGSAGSGFKMQGVTIR
jgi:hypothetical protein